MTISMYKASVPVFLQFLTSLSAVLDKAAAYAEATKVEPAVLLNTRLARLLARGFFASAPSGELRDCLARMGLEHPSGALERVEAALLKAALEKAP